MKIGRKGSSVIMSGKLSVIITSALLALCLILTGTAVSAAAPVTARVTIEASDGVAVSISSGNYKIGEPVDFSVTTKGDYLIRGIGITTEKGAVDFSVTGSYRYRFIMPSEDVNIKISAEDYGIVSYGECALGLWRLAGSPEAKDADIAILRGGKPDENPDADTVNSAAWAVANGIFPSSPVNEKIPDGTFDADKPLIREDLCRALANFAALMGSDTTKGAEEPETVDRELISESARDSVCWTVGNGIVDTENSAAGYFFRPAQKIVRCEYDRVISKFIAVTGIGAKNDDKNGKNDKNDKNETNADVGDMIIKCAPASNNCAQNRVSAD